MNEHKSINPSLARQGFVRYGHGPDQISWADLEAMVRGKVTPQELELLTIIQRLSQWKNGRHSGCWATNVYLGKALTNQVRVRNVQYMLAKLQQLGLLFGFRVGRRRYFKTKWLIDEKDGIVQGHCTSGMQGYCTQNNSSLLRKDSYKKKELPSPASAGSESTGDDDVNEFEEVKQQCRSTTTPKITDVDRARARRLYRYARDNGWMTSRSIKRSAQALAVMRRKLKDDDHKIDALIDHVVNNKVVKPRVYDGVKLTSEIVWNWLETEMTRAVKVGARALKVTAEVKGLGWPHGTASFLPKACQMSLDEADHLFAGLKAKIKRLGRNVERWKDKGRKYESVPPKLYRLRDFAARLGGRPSAFVLKYMRWLNVRVKHWEGGITKPERLAWSPTSTNGAAFGRELTGCANWDEIVKEVAG